MFSGSITFILISSTFLITFFAGMNYYSNGKVYGDEKKRIFGKKLLILPYGILATYIVLFFLYQKISFKPNQNDLIGKYEISEAHNIKIEKSEFGKYNLELKRNGEFYFTNKPEIDICESGTYKLYKSNNEIGIGFDCGSIYNTSQIVTSLWSFEIEFIIGDPDSGESICYKKIEN
jgi:hypothetical protein